jgi:2-dehydro-3-deoxygluconokinase
MSTLKVKSAADCRWDCVSLGEVMLRLDPGDMRIRSARSFRVWEGGGEYNVSRGLKKCFGLRTALVSAIVDNDVGYLLGDLISQGGVDSSYVKWMPFDGVGRNCRVGLNFTEAGFGVRAALGISDRGHSAASQLKRGDIDWKKLFKDDGVRWFHTGGIYAALSQTTPEVIEEAMTIARENGTIISYDLNYRPSLWKSVGGSSKAIEVNRKLASLVDVMIGNEEDFTTALGFEVAGVDDHLSTLDPKNFQKMIRQVITDYPNFKVVATTLRQARTATFNDWSAVLYTEGDFYQAREYKDLQIYDRVGGGDSFASGIIYGFLMDKTPEQSVNYGAAHGALAMTTPGDTSMVSVKEVEKIMGGGTARVER